MTRVTARSSVLCRRARPPLRTLGVVALALALATLAPAGCARQHDRAEPTAREPRAADLGLFSADDLVANQDALALTRAQRGALQSELSRAEGELNPLDASLREARAALGDALRGPRVDEGAAMERAARVTELESRIKLAHLRLLIRLKNILTPEQQSELERRVRGGEGARRERDAGER